MNTAAVSSRRDDLVRAFLQTDYLVSTAAGSLTVRIGAEHPRLDRQIGYRPWAIVTAFNPGATESASGDNRRRHARLVERTERAGLASLPACNRDPSGSWPDEPGLLVYPCDSDSARKLAREFGQLGVVTGAPGEMARLELIGKDWPADVSGPGVRVGG
ncbi:MAG: DUF3293 domain-containing protein [Wenzhouxiangella sp.]